MDLQEAITRGRFLFADAPGRLAIFELVNGRRTAVEIAKQLRRGPASVRNDLRRIADTGLIQLVRGGSGEEVKRDGQQLYEKIPIARAIPIRYFRTATIPTSTTPGKRGARRAVRPRRRDPKALKIPDERELIDIARNGEDQEIEFKAPGADLGDISKEVSAMLHSEKGGLLFYGIEDDGHVVGSDMTRQEFDQRLQNSLRNTVSPAASVTLRAVTVMGSTVLVVQVPPWNRTVHQYRGRVYVRKGTNCMVATPDELRRLHRGLPVK
jgi:DNA-binding Lrp family transcriptional regulator